MPKADPAGSLDGWWLALPAMLLCALILGPQLNSAFTIDDTLFLLQAKQALRDPLHPTAFDVVWSDVPQRLSAIMPSGPIMAYLLLPSVAHGGAEWIAHAVQVALLCVGLGCTAVLTRRLGGSRPQAALSALLVASSPAVLGMAGTAMPDVAAMTFGALGIERYLAFLSQTQKLARFWRFCQGLTAALALAAAALSRSHVGLLLGVALLFSLRVEAGSLRDEASPRSIPPRGLFGWAIDALQRTQKRQLWPLGLAVLLVGVVLSGTRDPLGGTGVVSSTRFFATLVAWPRNVLAFLSAMALTLPLTALWSLQRRAFLSDRVLRIGTAVALLSIPLTTTWVCLPLAPVLALSAACLVDILQSAWQRRDTTDLALSAWLLLALPVLFYIHFAPKYLVPSAPAAAILLARLIGRVIESSTSLSKADLARDRRLLAVFAVVALGSLLGVLILRANARFSALGRRAAHELIAPQVQRGERVWFCGHWGFQWYAQQAGAQPTARTSPQPQPGDLIVHSLRSECYYMPADVDRTPLSVLGDRTFGGRTMASEIGAGFFSNGAGYYPYMLSSLPIDRFELVRVLPPASAR